MIGNRNHEGRLPLHRNIREFLLEKGRRYNSLEEMPEYIRDSFEAIMKRYDLSGDPELARFLKKK